MAKATLVTGGSGPGPGECTEGEADREGEHRPTHPHGWRTYSCPGSWAVILCLGLPGGLSEALTRLLLALVLSSCSSHSLSKAWLKQHLF